MKKSYKILIAVIIILILILSLLIYYYLENHNKFINRRDNFKLEEIKEQSSELSSINIKSNIEVTDDQVIIYENLISDEVDVSVVKTSDGGKLNIEETTIEKLGDTTNTQSSEFYGLNSAAIATSNSTLEINNTTINTDAVGANAVFSTGNNSKIILNNVIINTLKDSSRGLDATYTGTIVANKVRINTNGLHCAAVATDRGEGNITITDSILNTSGAGSPCIYSTGNINIDYSYGTALASAIAVIEGKNSINIKNSNFVANGYGRDENGIDNCGIMIYQSMSGDAAEGVGTFSVSNSNLSILEKSSVYKIAPMFFSTNTDAIINIENTKLSFGSNILLKVTGNSGEWGKQGENGSNVEFNANNQELRGDIILDEISQVDISISNNSKLTSSINKDNIGKYIKIKLDKTSILSLTSDSYISCIEDELADFSNIYSNGYNIYYNSEECKNIDRKTIELNGGGKLIPLD